MDEIKLVVVDDSGKTWPNLLGVFRRVFPIVRGQVARDGKTQSVTYYGERFEIRAADAN